MQDDYYALIGANLFSIEYHRERTFTRRTTTTASTYQDHDPQGPSSSYEAINLQDSNSMHLSQKNSWTGTVGTDWESMTYQHHVDNSVPHRRS